jgi:hypothetical protein
MARKFGRRPEEIAAGLDRMSCPAGELGPWIKSDKAEFHHAGIEAQEWFLRLDKADVLKIEDAAKLVSSVRTAQKWAWRLWWAFTGGLSAAVLAGENLQKLPGMISGVISLIRGLL